MPGPFFRGPFYLPMVLLITWILKQVTILLYFNLRYRKKFSEISGSYFFRNPRIGKMAQPDHIISAPSFPGEFTGPFC